MRIKDYDLELAVQNKKVYNPEKLNTPLESYYHAGANCALYNIDQEKVLLFLEDFDYLKKENFLQNRHIIKKEEIGRIDLISYKYYKTPELFWLILAVNHHIDPFEMEEGMELLIPNLREFDLRSMLKSNFQQRS